MKIKAGILGVFVWLASFATGMAQTSNVEGSPYLNEVYASAEVWSGSSTQKLSVRYNIYQDLMEYKQNGQAFVLDPSNKIKKVKLGDDTFVVSRVEVDGKVKNGFLTVLDSGRVILMSKKVVKFSDAKKGGALDGTDLPARYTRGSDIFFFRFGTGEVKQVENLKSFIAAFPDKNEELTAFAKKEKISAKKEKDLVKLAKYYTGLFEE